MHNSEGYPEGLMQFRNEIFISRKTGSKMILTKLFVVPPYTF